MCLYSKHPTELIVALLDKATKSGVLRSNISLKGHLLFLNGPKGGLQVSIVSRRWLGGRVRSSLSRVREWRMWCRLNSLDIARYPIKVSQ